MWPREDRRVRTGARAMLDAKGTDASRRHELTGLAVCTVLAFQTPAFIMMRAYYKSSLCDSRILLVSEAMKCGISLVPIRNELHKLCDRVHLSMVPVAAYCLMNLASFWALKRLPAAVSIIIVQLKLLWATCFARAFLSRPMLNTKSLALVAIFIGAVATTANEKQQGADCSASESEPEVAASAVHATSLLAVAVLTFETMLSGFMSVYMQLIFVDQPQMMWLRNTQISFFSFFFYLFSEGLMPGGDAEACLRSGTYIPDVAGWAIAGMNAIGGLLVALGILYSGAVGKTVATTAAIPLTVLSEAIFIAHEMPTIVQSMLSAGVLNAVLMFMLMKA